MIKANTWVQGLLGESLLMPDGTLLPTLVALDMEDEKKKHLVVLHFECHWQTFGTIRSPDVLAKSYPELKAGNVEVVFVSNAETEEEFKADVSEISYPAVPFSDLTLRTKLCSETFETTSDRDWLQGLHGKDGKLVNMVVFLPEEGAGGFRWDVGDGFCKGASNQDMWSFETPEQMSVYAALEGAVNVTDREDAGNAAAVLQAFNNFDEDGNGTISKAELISVLRDLEDAWIHYTDAEMDRLFINVDADADGNISFEEFANWIFSGPKEDYATAQRFGLSQEAFGELNGEGEF